MKNKLIPDAIIPFPRAWAILPAPMNPTLASENSIFFPLLCKETIKQQRMNSLPKRPADVWQSIPSINNNQSNARSLDGVILTYIFVHISI